MTRAAIVALALALLAAACGGDDGGNDGQDAEPTTTTSSTTTTTTASTTSATSTTTTTTTTAPPAPTHDVEIATLNVLHGFPAASNCTLENDQCLAPTRADIIWDYLETDVGCPEIIALQEINARWFEIVPDKLDELCDGDHVMLAEVLGLPDQELILTTLPVLAHERVPLTGQGVWSAHWAQLDAGDGLVVDVFATHYASSSFNLPCDDTDPVIACGESCVAGTPLGDCHPFQTLDFLAARAAPGSLQLVVGDLNKEIDHVRITTLLDAGFVDTHVLAGHGECVDGSNENCTSGIGGEGPDPTLDGLDLADQSLGSRIDMILARPPAGCTVVVDVDDTDGDGTSTGIWANEPLPEPVEGLYWGADHAGIQADIGLVCS